MCSSKHLNSVTNHCNGCSRKTWSAIRVDRAKSLDPNRLKTTRVLRNLSNDFEFHRDNYELEASNVKSARRGVLLPDGEVTSKEIGVRFPRGTDVDYSDWEKSEYVPSKKDFTNDEFDPSTKSESDTKTPNIGREEPEKSGREVPNRENVIHEGSKHFNEITQTGETLEMETKKCRSKSNLIDSETREIPKEDSRSKDSPKILEKSPRTQNSKYFKSNAEKFKLKSSVPRYLQKKMSKALISKSGSFSPKLKTNHDEIGTNTFTKTDLNPSPEGIIIPFSERLNNIDNDEMKKTPLHRLFSKKETRVVSQTKKLSIKDRLLHRRGRSSSPFKFQKSSLYLRSNEVVSTRPLKRSFSIGAVAERFLAKEGEVFGRPLDFVCDENGFPHHTVMVMLEEIYQRGPVEIGIFRKSANARIVRELRERIDAGDSTSLENVREVPVNVIASLFKEFLRSLPNCLFCNKYYEDWLKVLSSEDQECRISRIHELCSFLPNSNLYLLKFTICVLSSIAANSEENLMTSFNLAVCIGPSVLNSGLCDLTYECKVPETLQFMIENFSSIFKEEKEWIQNTLEGKKTRNPKTESMSEYKLLSQTKRMSYISLSKDSGISSLFSHTSEEEGSNAQLFQPPSPSSSCSSDKIFCKYDEIDGVTPLRVQFKRDDWMRRCSVIKKIPRKPSQKHKIKVS